MKATPDMEEQILDQALAWRGVLQRDDADWDAFTVWLEADPRHRTAYDDLDLIDGMVEDHKTELAYFVDARREDPPSRWQTRRGALAGGIAAAVALAVAVPFFQQAPSDVVLRTQGSARSFALGRDGQVQLAPQSRLVLKNADARRLELAQGAAFFSIPHDPARTMTVKAGAYAVQDIGTDFAINLAGDHLVVGVSEGQVAVTPDGTRQAIPVAAGQQLTAGGSGPIRISRVRQDDVGSWRGGRLVYDNAEITGVAADIARFAGKRIVVDPSLSGRRFSGVLTIGDGSKLLQTFQALAPVRVVPEGDHVRLSAAGGR